MFSEVIYRATCNALVKFGFLCKLTISMFVYTFKRWDFVSVTIFRWITMYFDWHDNETTIFHVLEV